MSGAKRKLRIAAIIVFISVAAWLSLTQAGIMNRGLPSMTQSASQQGEHAYTNHLIHEKSPYLLMHAHNPVDWYPWGQEAFELARRDNKPIFLSVGYSTCHWCHVMEHESFENPEIAAMMNKYFVNIKVDREERPDVDRMYMTFVQATTGGGGWPMSVFLTPDLKPFFGGTYWPPEDRFGHPGFRTVLMRVGEAWQKDQKRIEQSANEVTEHLERAVNSPSAGQNRLQASTLDNTYRQIKASYDPAHGGFGGAPKFPRPVVFNFLLRYYARTGQKDSLDMTLHTLRAMADGGIHDHLGGGFHRYSVDERWHVPHFEKMLYDQAQLAISYLEAYQITHDRFYADTARDILNYVLTEMHSPEGGFYTAEDADSLIEKGKPEHGEGAFYVWTARQVEQTLDAEEAPVFEYYFNVKPDGNVPPNDDPQGEFHGKNILEVIHSVEDTAKRFGKSDAQIKQILADARKKLLVSRSQRPRPFRDDKVLTSWNGLMISAFARASQALGDPQYLAAAESSAEFIRSKLYDPETGTLKRRYRSGQAAINGFLDDYAYLINGLLDLYEASFKTSYLALAVHLQEKQDQLFWDGKQGGYFSTPPTDSSILVRMRDAYDGAEPSANSVAAMNLLRLWQMTDREAWREKAQKLFAAFDNQIEHSPLSVPQMIAAVDFALAKSKQVVIAGNPASPDTQALLRLVNERYLPNMILIVITSAEQRGQLVQWLPFTQGMQELHGKATAYICENYVCKLPTSDPQQVAHLLDAKP